MREQLLSRNRDERCALPFLPPGSDCCRYTCAGINCRMGALKQRSVSVQRIEHLRFAQLRSESPRAALRSVIRLAERRIHMLKRYLSG